MTTTIIGVNLENRLEKAIEFQKIITEFGCEIRTRIGLHPSKEQVCLNRGIVLLEVDGDPIEKVLVPGEVLKVDSGNVVAFEPTVSYEIETIKGLGNIFLGGEGLFLTKLVGPGKVIIQSQNFQDFANRLIPFMPSSNN